MYDHKNYLIALSGKMGSGKDTVADIILFLLWENDLAQLHKKGMLSIPKYSGPYSNEHIVKLTQDAHMVKLARLGSRFEIKRFAHKVKEIASLITGIPVEKFEDQAFKASFLGPEWSTREQGVGMQGALHTQYGSLKAAEADGWNMIGSGQFDTAYRDRMVPMRVRELLQKIGTDCMRDRLHTNVWVNSLFADWKLVGSANSNPPDSFSEVGLDVMTEWPAQKWLITDMRFPNELAAVKKHKGLSVRIDRPGYDSGSTHESETALDKHTKQFDYLLRNDGSLGDLVAKVREMLIQFKLL